jgi:V/A-type H+-transporting ATPase subunit I
MSTALDRLRRFRPVGTPGGVRSVGVPEDTRAAVPLPPPPGVQPPTLLRQRGRGRSFEVLVQAYTTVPYADVDPALVAGLAYVAMFGPTGLVPVVWLSPVDDVITLLVTAIGAGAVLLAGAYVLGIVNRFREGGWGLALYARTGIAGALLFLTLGGVAAGIYFDSGGLLIGAVLLGIAGLVLTFIGLLAGCGSGDAGVLQAIVTLTENADDPGSQRIEITDKGIGLWTELAR